MGLDELLQLAGVAALTIVPDDLQALRSTRRSEEEASSLSLFTNEVGINEKLDFPSYIDDEAKYCEDFGVVQGGNAPLKLEQVRQFFQSPNHDIITHYNLGNCDLLRLSRKG